MSHVHPASGYGPRRLSRAGSVTLSEALDLTPSVTIDSVPERRSPEGTSSVLRTTAASPLTLQIPSIGIERSLTLLEAITELEPEPEYTLEEALGSLYDKKNQDSSSDDSDVDITHDPSQRVSKERLSTHKNEFVVKEVTDFLEHAYSPTRRPSLHHQLRAFQQLSQLSPARPQTSIDKPGDSAVVPVPSTTSKHNILLSLIALQLLASTFTATHSPACLPAALYMTQVERSQPQMISSLKMHSLVSLQAPAAGHHARPSSPAPVWPALLEWDREEILADEVTRRRLDRIRLEKNAGNHTVKNDIVKEEKLVRWMWDPPTHPARLSNDDASTSGYSPQTGNLRRLSRTSADPHSYSKGKGRVQPSSSSAEITVQPSHPIRSSKNGTLFHPDNDRTASASSPQPSSRNPASSNIQSYHPKPPITFTASPSSTALRSTPHSDLHTYPSPPSTPSPLNARLARTGNFEFHPIIRAEPHPVYVQPVKAIAVKRKRFAYAGNRWQRMRERESLSRQRDARGGLRQADAGTGSHDELRRRSSGGGGA